MAAMTLAQFTEGGPQDQTLYNLGEAQVLSPAVDWSKNVHMHRGITMPRPDPPRI